MDAVDKLSGAALFYILPGEEGHYFVLFDVTQTHSTISHRLLDIASGRPIGLRLKVYLI